MSLFTSSISAITRPGIYLVANKSPSAVKATGTGISCLVCETPWGPPQTLVTPANDGDRNLTFAPPGFSRTASGILAMIEKAWPVLKVVRVLNSAAVKATAALQNAVPTTIVTVTAKYAGADANSMVATVSASTDGISGHFKLTVSITGASGTSTESFDNLNVTGTGADYLGADKWDQSNLITSIVKNATGTPISASTSFSSGANGTIVSSDYVGTQGSADKGLALLEGDPTIRQFCTDDVGNSMRAAVNAGIAAHALYTGDRIGAMNGNSGQSAAAAQADVVNYQGPNDVYCDPWCNILDDVTGASHLVPTAPFATSLQAQLPPSVRIAWRDARVINMLAGIQSLEANRGAAAGVNTTFGITTFIPNENGGTCIELDVTTETPLDSTQQDLPRQRMGIYIGTALKKSFPSSVNGPNVPITQDDILRALTAFMEDLKKNQNVDPFNLPYVLDYSIGDITTVNTKTSTQAGRFIVPLTVETDAGMQEIIFNITYGSTVTITVSGSGA